MYVIYGDNKDMELFVPFYDDFSFPDITDVEFQKKFHHDTWLSFDKKEMVEILKFFEPFVKGVQNQQLLFSIEEDNTISILSEQGIKANREISIIDKNISGSISSFYFGREFLLKTLTSMKEDSPIKLEVGNDSPANNIVGEKSNIQIPIIRLV